VEVEIVFWAFGMVKYRTEYFVTLETIFDEDDVAHMKWGMEKPDSEQFWRVRHQRIVFVGYHPRYIETIGEGMGQWLAAPHRYLF
jgi:hypothetical protein